MHWFFIILFVVIIVVEFSRMIFGRISELFAANPGPVVFFGVMAILFFLIMKGNSSKPEEPSGSSSGGTSGGSDSDSSSSSSYGFASSGADDEDDSEGSEAKGSDEDDDGPGIGNISFSVRVVDEDGEAVEGASVDVTVHALTGTTEHEETDSDGWAHFTVGTVLRSFVEQGVTVSIEVNGEEEAHKIFVTDDETFSFTINE